MANVLDCLIEYVAPAAAVRRARSRLALEIHARGYEAGRRTTRTSGWKTTNGSGTAEITAGLTDMRARSRDLCQNNPYGKRAIGSLRRHAIGAGIVARTKNKAAQKAWKLWIKECDYYAQSDFYGLQAIAARGVFEAGEVLIRRHFVDPKTTRSGIGLKLQLIEPDCIDTRKFGAIGENFIIAGREVDKGGRVVARWIYDQHPGDAAVRNTLLKSSRLTPDELFSVFEAVEGRPGQILGVPKLHASIIKARDLDEYEDAHLLRKKIAACFAAFVTTSDESRKLGISQIPGSVQSDGTTTPRTESITPGIIEYLQPDESVSFSEPADAPGYGDYTATQLRAIAVGADVSYEALTGDLSKVNFSSMRAGRQDFKLVIEDFRWLTFIPQFCDRVGGWFADYAFAANVTRVADVEFIWQPPRWEYVNPLEDVKTEQAELASGLDSLVSKIRARGEDPEEKIAEMQESAQLLEKYGVTVSFGAAGNGAAITSDPAPVAGPAVDPAPVAVAASLPDVNARNTETAALLARIAALEAAAGKQSNVAVNFADGAFRMEPKIDVVTPEVRVENHVAPPNVQVDNHVAAPVVNVAHARRATETITRDANLEIIGRTTDYEVDK